jgi:hypothetical protein
VGVTERRELGLQDVNLGALGVPVEVEHQGIGVVAAYAVGTCRRYQAVVPELPAAVEPLELLDQPVSPPSRVKAMSATPTADTGTRTVVHRSVFPLEVSRHPSTGGRGRQGVGTGSGSVPGVEPVWAEGSTAGVVEQVLAGVRPAMTSAKKPMTAGTARHPTRP